MGSFQTVPVTFVSLKLQTLGWLHTTGVGVFVAIFCFQIEEVVNVRVKIPVSSYVVKAVVLHHEIHHVLDLWIVSAAVRSVHIHCESRPFLSDQSMLSWQESSAVSSSKDQGPCRARQKQALLEKRPRPKLWLPSLLCVHRIGLFGCREDSQSMFDVHLILPSLKTAVKLWAPTDTRRLSTCITLITM